MPLASAAGFAALRNRDFAFYLSASFLATTALAMQSVALGWQIYYLTGKPFDLGLVGLAEFLPAFVLALVSGQIADRFDRRLVVFVGLLAEAAAASSLIVMVAARPGERRRHPDGGLHLRPGAGDFHAGAARHDAQPDPAG